MGGTILRTTDGGTTWINQSPQTQTWWLYDVFFTDSMIGTAVGVDGTILRTTTGGTVWVNDEKTEIPQHYLLHQNYPKPFNPVTTIAYQIPKSGFVQLKVYDLIGRIMATLVNEEKSAGNYQVEFNATNLPSGVYIYSLRVNEFVQNNKMILMK